MQSFISRRVTLCLIPGFVLDADTERSRSPGGISVVVKALPPRKHESPHPNGDQIADGPGSLTYMLIS